MSYQGDKRTERQLVGWYLVLRGAHPGSSRLRPEHFFEGDHRKWWAQALEVDSWTPADLGMTMDQERAYSDIGVTLISRMVPALEDRVVDSWAREYLRERLIEAEAKLCKSEFDGIRDATSYLREVCGRAEAGTLRTSEAIGDVEVRTIRDWAKRVLDKPKVIPMPLHGLRRRVPGWLRGRLFGVGGRSSEHKTTFLRMSASYAAQHGFGPLHITLEDSAEDLAAREIASEVHEFTTGDLIHGTIPREFPMDRQGEILGKVLALADADRSKRHRVLDIAGVDMPGLIGLLRAEARGIDIVFIENIQLVRSDTERTKDFWDRLCIGLHQAAKELDIAVVVASHVDKASQAEKKPTGAPRMISMLQAQSLITAAYGIVMVGLTEDDRWEASVQKWKSVKRFSARFGLDAAHDTILDEEGR